MSHILEERGMRTLFGGVAGRISAHLEERRKERWFRATLRKSLHSDRSVQLSAEEREHLAGLAQETHCAASDLEQSFLQMGRPSLRVFRIHVQYCLKNALAI